MLAIQRMGFGADASTTIRELQTQMNRFLDDLFKIDVTGTVTSETVTRLPGAAQEALDRVGFPAALLLGSLVAAASGSMDVKAVEANVDALATAFRQVKVAGETATPAEQAALKNFLAAIVGEGAAAVQAATSAAAAVAQAGGSPAQQVQAAQVAVAKARPFYKKPLFWAAVGSGTVLLLGVRAFLRGSARRTASPATPPAV